MNNTDSQTHYNQNNTDSQTHYNQNITYTYLEEKQIHILTFEKASRQAIDESIQIMNMIYKDVTETDTVCLLIDYRKSGIPSIRQFITRGIGWVRGLEVHPRAFVAVAVRRDVLLNLFERMIETFRFGHLTTRFFEGENSYEEALKWLEEIKS